MRAKIVTFHMGTIASVLLLIAFIVTFVFGLIQVRPGLHQFVYHKYAAYTVAVLTVLHLAFNARRLVARLRQIFGRKTADAASLVEQCEEDSVAENRPGSLLPREASSRRDFLRTSLVTAALGIVVSSLPRRLFAQGKSAQKEESSKLSIDEEYHRLSKPSLVGKRRKRETGEPPPLYKTYPNAKVVSLPREMEFQAPSLPAVINKRRSVRDYTAQPISLNQLSQLLHYANGITERRKFLASEVALRAAPSAGALYDTEIYVVANNVSQLEKGLYHYNVRDHALELLNAKNLASEAMHAALSQEFVARASVVFILSSVFRRVRDKYGNRAYRFCLMGAGHIGQNVYLTATAMGLGTCAVGAFDDDAVNQLIGVDGLNEAVLYMMPVGTR